MFRTPLDLLFVLLSGLLVCLVAYGVGVQIAKAQTLDTCETPVCCEVMGKAEVTGLNPTTWGNKVKYVGGTGGKQAQTIRSHVNALGGSRTAHNTLKIGRRLN